MCMFVSTYLYSVHFFILQFYGSRKLKDGHYENSNLKNSYTAYTLSLCVCTPHVHVHAHHHLMLKLWHL